MRKVKKGKTVKRSNKIGVCIAGGFILTSYIGLYVIPNEGETTMGVTNSYKQQYLNGKSFTAEDMYVIPPLPEEVVAKYTREGVIQTLNERFAGGLLHGMGSLLVESVEYERYEEDYGLDTLEWALKIGAIIELESRTIINGKWVVATSYNCRTNNNICGMNVRSATSSTERYNLKWDGNRVDYERSGRYAKYPSIAESLRDMVYWLRVRYIMNGLDTIAKIHLVYAPLDDPEEGMHGMDNFNWANHVTTFYNQLALRAEELSK